jgi:predicted RNA-binding protein
MCESDAYIKDDGKEELLAKEIVTLMPRGNGYILIDLSGNKYELNDVVIDHINFVAHKIFFKKIKR